MRSFAAGFFCCYALAAALWGSILFRMDFPTQKAIWQAANWPSSLLRIATAEVTRR